MDFELRIDGQIFIFDTFHPMMEMITREVSQWNAYDPELPIELSIRKVKGGDSLGVAVKDHIKLDEKIS